MPPVCAGYLGIACWYAANLMLLFLMHLVIVLSTLFHSTIRRATLSYVIYPDGGVIPLEYFN